MKKNITFLYFLYVHSKYTFEKVNMYIESLVFVQSSERGSLLRGNDNKTVMRQGIQFVYLCSLLHNSHFTTCGNCCHWDILVLVLKIEPQPTS